ncbi:MAG: xanthine dehydrogenase family protein molybdopterin-binding subunit [Aliiglaciecola sp.]
MNAAINSRRDFLRYSFYSGALLIAAPLSFSSRAENLDSAVGSITPLIRIAQDNSVVFYSPSPEMGQGTNTALSMLFAEELGADMKNVSVEPLPYELKRDDEGKITWKVIPQFAGGSTSISRNYELLRNAGANAKQLFLMAAASMFKVNIDSLSTENGYIVMSNGRKVSLGYLAESAAKQILPEGFKPTLKDKDDWRIIGKPHNTQEAIDIVTGKPLYGMDMQYPGAKVAMVQRSPYFDGDVESFDASEALAMPGVHQVVRLPRPDVNKYYTYLAGGIAVIADDFWTAKKARETLKIKWDKGPYAEASTADLHKKCDELLKEPGQVVRNDGDIKKALANAAQIISHTYKIPLVSHAQLEPQNCIAHVTDSKCTIIGPMQSPGSASRLAEAITGFDRVNMDIRYTRLGGGFGRRLNSDHTAEAVMISKLSKLPIKLIWTREDDLRNDFYRPMGHHQLTAGVDDSGNVIAWSHHLVGTPKYYRRNNAKPEELFGADIYVDDFPAGRVENLQYEYTPVTFGAPQGSWRAPAHTANAFVVQSFIDEIARATNQDPLALRIKMLGEHEELPYAQHGGPTFDTGRMAAVLKKAAQLANWGKKMPSGNALGIAGHFTFGGYCACVAEVSIKPNNQFRVNKVYAAIDVGTVVNPEGVIAQVEGGINDGLSTALGQQIIVENGQVQNDNFDRYNMMRIGDSVISIEVAVVDSNASPVGAGEMGIPPLAPAVANALAAAGDIRIRHHPMRA